MKLYDPASGSERRISFDEEFAAAAEEFPETAGFLPAIDAVHVPLAQALEARVTAEKPLPKRRAKRKVRELRVDRTISAQGDRIEALEKRKNGPLFQALFPQGTYAVTAPKGEAQLTAAADYRTRIVNCKLKELTDALRAELLAELDGVVGRLSEAQTALTATEAEVAKLRQVEEARRGDHLRTMDSLFGELRRIFPRDRAMQDAVAPEAPARKKKKKKGEPKDPQG